MLFKKQYLTMSALLLKVSYTVLRKHLYNNEVLFIYLTFS